MLTIIGVILGCIFCIYIGWHMASDAKEIEYRDVIDLNDKLVQQNKDLVGKIAELTKNNTYKKEWKV